MADPVAIADIYISRGVRAHRAGEEVPAENVAENGWEHLVSGSGTKAVAAVRQDEGSKV